MVFFLAQRSNCCFRGIFRFRKICTMDGPKVEGATTPTKMEASTSELKPKRSTFNGISPMPKINIASPSDRPFRVSIEGNIGAGKSTLIQYFSSYPHIETYPEPIEWWRNCRGHNLLHLLYEDINKWHTTFQTYVQLTRLKIQSSKPSKSTTTVQMFERSVQNNRFCFVEQAYTNGYLHDLEYNILDQQYRWIRQNVDIDLDLIVYLRTSPETAYQRTMARNRAEESGITLEYLTQLHESHDRWLMSNNERFNAIPVLVLDADKMMRDILEDLKMNERRILGDMNITRIVTEEEKNRVKRALNTKF